MFLEKNMYSLLAEMRKKVKPTSETHIKHTIKIKHIIRERQDPGCPALRLKEFFIMYNYYILSYSGTSMPAKGKSH